MASSSVLPSTVIDYAERKHGDAKESGSSSRLASLVASSSRNVFTRHVESSPRDETEDTQGNAELKLPSWRSMFVVIGGNALFQIAFFIVVSSASVYAALLGGTATFSGLTIGIPPAISGLFLVFITRYDGGRYSLPLNISIVAFILGNILYSLAYPLSFLYLLLIGRIVSGFGFISFMYSKRFCADPRIVGVRRRTTLAGWLVIGQAIGFSAGPFIGGLLYRVGFSDATTKGRVWNGVTAPGWVMAGVFVLFGVLSNLFFQDVPARPQERRIELSQFSSQQTLPETEAQPSDSAQSTHPAEDEPSFRNITRAQWGVITCMCYYSMMSFFILGSWEANIPVFTALPSVLSYTPYNAGNFIALGGVVSFPLLLLINIRFAGRLSDRTILGLGTSLGLIGLLLMLSMLLADRVTFASLFVCWALVAFGFNLASTCCLSLLSKQLPDTWSRPASMAIQYSNYAGRVSGAILGGSGVKMGMERYVGVQIGVVGLGAMLYLTLWRQLKAKTG